MKRVMLTNHGPFKAKEVLTTMLDTPPPGQGITYADMRKRFRINSILEKSDGYMDLEDADYQVLKGILDVFQWSTGRRELMFILAEVDEAKEITMPREVKGLRKNELSS